MFCQVVETSEEDVKPSHMNSDDPISLASIESQSEKKTVRRSCCCLYCSRGEKKFVGLKQIHLCPYCKKTFERGSKFLSHLPVHTGERPHVCSEPSCGKSFKRHEELTRHEKIHTGQRFPCPHCDRMFTRKDHLTVHLKTRVCTKNVFAE